MSSIEKFSNPTNVDKFQKLKEYRYGVVWSCSNFGNRDTVLNW